MAIAIGALSVDLGANSAAFVADMGKAQRVLGSSSARMNRSLARMDKGWGAVDRTMGRVAGRFLAVAGPAALLLLTKRSLQAADAIGKTADGIGIGTDALQEYRHAAVLAGVETQSIDGAFQAFGKRLGELKVGTGTLTTFLDKFDKQLKQNIVTAGSTEAALELIFEAMAETADQSEKAALAAAAFGRTAGVRMVNMVRDGADELRAMREEARALGLVLDEDLIRGAEQANDQLSRLSGVLDTKMTASLVNLAPLIDRTATGLLRMSEGAKLAYANVFKDAADFDAVEILNQIRISEEEIAERRRRLARFESAGDTERVNKIREQIAGQQRILDIWKARLEVVKRLGARGTPPPAAGAAKDTIVALQNQIDRQVASLNSRNLLFGESEGVIARANAAMQINNRLSDANVDRTKAIVKAFDPYLNALERATDESARLREAERQRLEEQRALERRLEEERREAEQRLEEQRRLTEQNANSAARAITGGMERMILGAESAADAMRNLSEEILQVILRAAVLGPLEAGLTSAFAGAFGGAAGAGASGGGTQPLPIAAASGADFIVGGRGGTDANYVPLALTKGERVTVKTEAQQRGGGQAGGVTIGHIDMRGAAPEAVARLEQLLSQLNASIEPRIVATLVDVRRRGGRAGS